MNHLVEGGWRQGTEPRRYEAKQNIYLSTGRICCYFNFILTKIFTLKTAAACLNNQKHDILLLSAFSTSPWQLGAPILILPLSIAHKGNNMGKATGIHILPLIDIYICVCACVLDYILPSTMKHNVNYYITVPSYIFSTKLFVFTPICWLIGQFVSKI